MNNNNISLNGALKIFTGLIALFGIVQFILNFTLKPFIEDLREIKTKVYAIEIYLRNESHTGSKESIEKSNEILDSLMVAIKDSLERMAQ